MNIVLGKICRIYLCLLEITLIDLWVYFSILIFQRLTVTVTECKESFGSNRLNTNFKIRQCVEIFLSVILNESALWPATLLGHRKSH